ncbi:hypothetical protein [Cupriavidus sp. KB_39]|uniref:hypothetical protein n=1 Tax=Cupriavidus sp. KB_39 TaxID=3233036 RepID=UPI003F90A61B
MSREAKFWFVQEVIPRIIARLSEVGLVAELVQPSSNDTVPLLLITAKRRPDAVHQFDLAATCTWNDLEVNIFYEDSQDLVDDLVYRIPNELAECDGLGSIDWATRSQNSSTPIGLGYLELIRGR